MARARSLAGWHRAGPASSTPTSAILSTSHTNGRLGRWSPTRAERVLEALYQDAIRQRIDDVYGAYVMALAARQTVVYAKKSVARLGELRTLTEQRYEKKYISLGELNAVKIKQQNAQLGLVDSEAAYRKAKLDLGSFMNLTHEEIAVARTSRDDR